MNIVLCKVMITRRSYDEFLLHLACSCQNITNSITEVINIRKRHFKIFIYNIIIIYINFYICVSFTFGNFVVEAKSSENHDTDSKKKENAKKAERNKVKKNYKNSRCVFYWPRKQSEYLEGKYDDIDVLVKRDMELMEQKR